MADRTAYQVIGLCALNALTAPLGIAPRGFLLNEGRMNTELFKQTNAVRMYILAGLLGVISLVHYLLGLSTPGILHGILGHLYIVPIMLGAYWFGIRGGVAVSALSCLLFSPHFFFHWHDPLMKVYNYVELFLFVLIGVVTGILSRMEQQQRLQREEALAKLKAQTEILFRTEEQLRRADRLTALGELSAGMAHEIRNPLGSIKGAVEILQDDYSENDPKYEFIKILLKETDRLNHILQEFLGFARPRTPEFQYADVNGIIESVLLLVSQQAKTARVDVEKRLDPGVGRRSVDADLLKQAILNIVLNAIQAMPKGGTLTVSSEANAGMLGLTFEDTGTGMNDETKKKLFSPFFTTKKTGTGLGLAITYRIIENHAGSITVESEQGKGTKFIVSLPA
jgi:two-component system sensor histidine kinase HydH